MGSRNSMRIMVTKRLSSYQRSLRRTGFLIVLPVFLYFALVYWYPLIQAFLMSFQETIPGLKMKFAGLKTYKVVFTEPLFWVSFLHTLLFSLQAVVLVVLLALALAIALNTLRQERLKNILTLAYILPTLVSLAAAGFIWEWLLHPRYGLANQVLGLLSLPAMKFLLDQKQVIPSLAVINGWVRVGFSMLILLAGLQSIPESFFDAAKVDGAKGFTMTWHITLPLLMPQIGAVTLLEVIFGLKIFDIVYVTTQGGPAGASEMLMLYLYNNAFRFYRTDKAAVASVFIFLTLLAFGIFQRRIMYGKKYEYEY